MALGFILVFVGIKTQISLFHFPINKCNTCVFASYLNFLKEQKKGRNYVRLLMVKNYRFSTTRIVGKLLCLMWVIGELNIILRKA